MPPGPTSGWTSLRCRGAARPYHNDTSNAASPERGDCFAAWEAVFRISWGLLLFWAGLRSRKRRGRGASTKRAVLSVPTATTKHHRAARASPRLVNSVVGLGHLSGDSVQRRAVFIGGSGKSGLDARLSQCTEPRTHSPVAAHRVEQGLTNKQASCYLPLGVCFIDDSFPPRLPYPNTCQDSLRSGGPAK